MQQILFIKPVKKMVVKLSKWCAYSHIFHLLISRLKGENMSNEAKAGRNIALLGFFCPFFWYSLFSGADKSTITFHAIHSGIVFLFGVVIMVISFIQKK